jgi:hypothetical protein
MKSDDLTAYLSLSREQLADTLNTNNQAVDGWDSEGLPANVGSNPKTYDLGLVIAWTAGHRLCKRKPLLDVVEITAAEKTALGWFAGNSPGVGSRLQDLRVFVETLDRAGIDAKEAIAALHKAMGLIYIEHFN